MKEGLYYGKDPLHYIIGAALKQQHFESLVARGFTGTIDDLTAVSHLDDNSLNINTSNLLNLPAAWNQNLKKARKVQKRGKSYYCQVTIGESDAYQTVYVDNPEEALFQYDILKFIKTSTISHCSFGLVLPEELSWKTRTQIG